MCIGRVLPQSVSQPTFKIRKTSAQASLPSHRVIRSHRTAVFYPSGRKNAHRNPDPRHDPVRSNFPVASSVAIRQHGLSCCSSCSSCSSCQRLDVAPRRVECLHEHVTHGLLAAADASNGVAAAVVVIVVDDRPFFSSRKRYFLLFGSKCCQC